MANSKSFLKDLKTEFSEDNVTTNAAALAFYLFFALFPALLLALALIPYLPIQNVDQAIMDLLRQALPGESSSMLTDEVQNVANQKQGGLLSIGIIATLWAASSGTYAMMQALNTAYDVKEERSFIKGRAVALGLTLLLGAVVIVSFALIVLGGVIQDWMTQTLGWGGVLSVVFAVLRYAIIAAMLTGVFMLAYRVGPALRRERKKRQKFRNLLPGSLFAMAALVVATLGFRFYVSNFGNYSATYGSVGAVIVLMLWLYIGSVMILTGAEITALVERRRAHSAAREPERRRKAA